MQRLLSVLGTNVRYDSLRLHIESLSGFCVHDTDHLEAGALDVEGGVGARRYTPTFPSSFESKGMSFAGAEIRDGFQEL